VVKAILHKAASPSQTDGFIAITRWCQRYLIYNSVDTRLNIPNGISIGTAVFCTVGRIWKNVSTVYNGPPQPPHNCLFAWGCEPAANTLFVGPPESISAKP